MSQLFLRSFKSANLLGFGFGLGFDLVLGLFFCLGVFGFGFVFFFLGKQVVTGFLNVGFSNCSTTETSKISLY